MSEQLKRLVAEQNRTFARMQELQERAETEGRDWTAEERQNWDEANSRLDVLEGDIARLEGAARREAVDFSKFVSTTGNAETPEDREARAKAEDERYVRAFGTYMRCGFGGLTADEQSLLLTRATTDPQATTPGADGGYLIPPGYRAVMTETMKAFGGLYNHAHIIDTATGNPLQWPTNNDTANKGSIISENAAVTTNHVVLGTKTIGAYTYSSDQVLVSMELLQDSVFDLDTFLPRKLGERIGRIYADHFITGNGSSQPEGILTNATSGVTAASGSLSYDNVIDLEHSVDPAYRASGRCRFIFADSTLAVLRKLKDTQNRPLWLPVPVPGMPATINGLPYTIDQSMPAVGTGNKSIAFGDFQAAYIVRQVRDIQFARLAERYAEKRQVGYFAFSRMDAKVDDSAAYRVLTHA